MIFQSRYAEYSLTHLNYMTLDEFSNLVARLKGVLNVVKNTLSTMFDRMNMCQMLNTIVCQYVPDN